MTRKFCVASARKSSRSPRPTFRDFFFVRCDGGAKKALPKKRAWVACAHNVAHSFFGEVQPSWLTKLVLFEAPLPPLVHFALLWLGELCVRGQLFASEPPTFVLLNSAQHDISLKSTLNSSVNLFFLASQVLFCSFRPFNGPLAPRHELAVHPLRRRAHGADTCARLPTN